MAEAERDRDLIRVLLIEDDEDDYVLARGLLADVRGQRFHVQWVSTWEAGLAELLAGAHDVALVDYHLGGHTGVELLRDAIRRGCRVPVILLTGQADRETDLLAMRSGASDYLVKGQVTADMLDRSIRYALERGKLIEEIRSLSLTDDLTGLHNRRGFFTLCEQRLRALERREVPCIIIFADLDGLKRVNDTMGHDAGDRLLVDAAIILRSTFRKTDLVARIGGDEFVIFADEVTTREAEKMIERLQTNIREFNATSERAYPVALSAGAFSFLSNESQDLAALLARADEVMLREKRRRKLAHAESARDASTPGLAKGQATAQR